MIKVVFSASPEMFIAAAVAAAVEMCSLIHADQLRRVTFK